MLWLLFADVEMLDLDEGVASASTSIALEAELVPETSDRLTFFICSSAARSRICVDGLPDLLLLLLLPW